MAQYYFDLNGNTAGFGTLTGAWNTTSLFWSTNSAGTANPSAVTFTNLDIANFGFAGTTATAGTATIADGLTVTLNQIVTANLAGLQTIAATGSGKLFFSGTTPTITVNSAGNLTISSIIDGVGGFTKNGTNIVTLSAANTISGDVFVSSPASGITISNALALQNATLNYLTTGNTISYGALTSITLGGLKGDRSFTLPTGTTTVGNDNLNNTYTGAFSASTGALTKVGTGKWTLTSSTSARTGATTISGGSIVLQNGNALGNTATGAITVASGAALEFVGGITTPTKSITINGTGNTQDGSLGALRSISGANTHAGAIVLASNSNIGVDADSLTTSGIISGAFVLNKVGAGDLRLNAVNTYSGDTEISGGTITLLNASGLAGSTLDYGSYGGTLSFGALTAATFAGLKGSQNLALTNASSAAVALTLGGNNADDTYSGNLSGTGSITKNGTGTFALSGNNSFTGAITLNSGTISFASTTAIPTNLTNSVVMNATFTSTNILGTVYSFDAPITTNKTFSFVHTGTSTYSNINMGGSVSNNLTATITSALSLSGGTTPLFQLVGYGTLVLTNGITATVAATRVGSYAASGSFDGKSILKIPDITKLSSNVNFIFQYGNILETDSANFTWSYGSTSSTFRSSSVTAAGGFSSSSAGGLTVGANISFNSSTASPNTQWYGVMYLGNSYGTSVGKVTLSGTLTLAATQIFFVNPLIGGGISGEFTNVVSGAGGLTKQGTGTLRLTATNTYAGATLISAGALRIFGATGAINSSSGVTVSNGAALELDTVTTAVSRAITLNGTGIGGTGALRNLAGTNTYSGLITLGMSGTTIYADAGTLNITNAGTIAGSGFNLTFAGAGNIAVTSIIGTTTGTLTKTDGGTLTLTGANTFTGNTFPNGGSILVNNTLALQFSEVVHNSTGSVTFGTAITAATFGALSSTVSGNTIALTNTNATPAAVALTVGGKGTSTSYAGTLTGLGSLIKTGAGTFTLSNTNTYAGTTTVGAGVLSLTGAITGAGTVSVNAGGTLEGTGSITNAVSVANSATAVISAGVSGLGGNLTMGSLTFAGAAKVKVTNSSYLAVTALNTGSGTLTVDFTSSVALVSGNKYPVISYGTKSGTGSFVAGTITAPVAVDPHDTFGFADNLTAKQIEATFTANIANVALTWSGTDSVSFWDTTTSNKVWTYTPTSFSTYFKNGDGAVTFNSSSPVVNDSVTVGSGGISVTGTGANFYRSSLSFDPVITNNGPLTIAANAMVGLGVSGTHGAITIGAGATLQVDHPSAIQGTDAITMSAGSSFFTWNTGAATVSRNIAAPTGNFNATITKYNGSDVVELSGVISGWASSTTSYHVLVKGGGISYFSGTNTYRQQTYITDINTNPGENVLRANQGVGLPVNSRLAFDYGGILETDATTFTRSYGVAATQMVLGGGGGAGGFSAYSPSGLTVTNGGATLTFGTTTASQWYGPLYFGTAWGTSRGQVTWTSAMNLNGQTQVFHVFDGDADTTLYPNGSRAEISGKISGTNVNGTVNKRGPGILKLSNDTSDYYSDTYIYEGILEFTSIDNMYDGVTAYPSSLGSSRASPDGSAYSYIFFGSVTEPLSYAENAVLKYVGTNPNGHSSDRYVVASNGGGTVDASGVGPLILSGGIFASIGDQVVLQGTNQTENYTFVNQGSQLVKQGIGKWRVFANNTSQIVLLGGTLSPISNTALGGGTVSSMLIAGSCLLDLNNISTNVQVRAITLTSGTISNGNLTSSYTHTMSAGFVYAGLRGTAGINKTTTGTLLLAGVNTYTGATVIAANGGTIVAESETGTNIFGSGASAHVTVNQGGKIHTKTGTLQQGKMTYPANLTFNGTSGNKARIRIGKPEAVALVQVDGGLKFTAATTIDLSTSGLAAGEYVLFDYGRGSFFGGQAELAYVTVTPPTGLTTATVTDNVSEKKVYLTLA